MSEEREIKEFSINLYYTNEEDKFTILDHNFNEIGNFIQQFDQEGKSFHLFDYNFSKFSLFQLQEYFFFQLDVPIVCHAVKIKIDGFPLKIDYINQILSSFKKEYGDNFVIEKIEEKGEKYDIEIKLSQPKKTHYIQQAYLRNFSSNRSEWIPSNNKSKARIFAYDKANEQVINVGNTDPEIKCGQKIESVAYEEYYYSLKLEKFMVDMLEKQIPSIFEKLFSIKSITSLTLSEKKLFVKYLILTWNRTTEARAQMKEAYEKGIMETIKMAPELKIPKNAIPVINEDYLRFMHESQIFRFLDETSDVYLVDRIVNITWLLNEAKGQNFFFTSDNPIIFHNSHYEKEKTKNNDFIAIIRENTLSELKNDKRAGEGMLLTSEHPENRPGVEGVEIYFPINPQFCMILVDWQRGFERLKIGQINEQIALQANRYVYSHQGDFILIKEALRRHPEMKDKKDKRAIVKPILQEKKREGDFKFKAFSTEDILRK